MEYSEVKRTMRDTFKIHTSRDTSTRKVAGFKRHAMHRSVADLIGKFHLHQHYKLA